MLGKKQERHGYDQLVKWWIEHNSLSDSYVVKNAQSLFRDCMYMFNKVHTVKHNEERTFSENILRQLYI